ncbi:acetylxylan esterase [Labilibacter sediminis]|nr:acetylxylan esterase [Labilibacter sediminis]
MRNFKLLHLIILLILPSFLFSQPARKDVNIIITPVSNDWTYDLSENASFEVKVENKEGDLIPNVNISYTIGLEKIGEVRSSGSEVLKNGETIIEGVSLGVPGFIECKVSAEVNGKKYYGSGTAGFEPEKIKPTVSMPDDFDAFWSKAKDDLSKVPMNAIATLETELCTDEINVYHIRIDNYKALTTYRGNSRIYGMLSVPKKAGKYPAILQVPGAGIRQYGRDDRAAKGVMVLSIGIHGIPVNMEQSFYDDLRGGALHNYYSMELYDKNKYYYKRVYLGCVRAIDYIYSRPEFDGNNIAVSGGSQGGALSIVTAALDQRVDCLAAFYPALCDLTGPLDGRTGGWPNMLMNKKDRMANPLWEKNICYFDVVNFAKKLKVQGWYSWGFNDKVCPPTSTYAAYNSIRAAKELHIYHETEHWTYPEQKENCNLWLYQKLGVIP